MKKLLVILLLFLASCQNSDFSLIKKGMKSSEVIKLVGNPKEKMPMFICDWWKYNDKGKHIIIISKDTVTNITTEAEFKKAMKDATLLIDSLQNTLK